MITVHEPHIVGAYITNMVRETIVAGVSLPKPRVLVDLTPHPVMTCDSRHMSVAPIQIMRTRRIAVVSKRAAAVITAVLRNSTQAQSRAKPC